METKQHNSETTLHTAVMIFIYLVMGINIGANGQSVQRITHSGIEASYGIHGFKSSEKEEKLQGFTKGMSVGFVTGNNILKVRIRPVGYYKSTGLEKRKFSIVESEAMVNLYPLEFIRTSKQVLDIYISTGVHSSNIKYNDRNVFKQVDGTNDQTLIDYQALNKATVVSQMAGIGFEYHLPFSFVHVFSEVLFSNTIYSSSENIHFKNSLSQTTTRINFGVRFGSKKALKEKKIF